SAGPSSYGAPYEIGSTVRVRTPPRQRGDGPVGGRVAAGALAGRRGGARARWAPADGGRASGGWSRPRIPPDELVAPDPARTVHRTRSAGPYEFALPRACVRDGPAGGGRVWGGVGGRRAGSAAEHGAVGGAVGGAGLVEGDLADRAHAGAEGPVARDAEGGRLAQARDAVGEAGLEVADPLEEPAVQVDGGDVGGLHEPAVLAEVV